MQNSTVIAKYTSNSSKGLWKAHGNYLSRENSQKESEKGAGFNNEHSELNIGTLLNDWQNAGDPRLWKIIISPEFGDKLDLKEHTILLVEQIEIDLDTKLSWVAIDHYNTENPHVHLLIRGIDEEGKALDIDPGYLKSGIRTRSREIATNQLGYRTQVHAELARSKQIESDRYTALDHVILHNSLQTAQGYTLTLEEASELTESAKKYRLDLIKRLRKLETLGVANRKDNHIWQLLPNFKEKMKEVGRYAAGLKILERHRNKMSNSEQALAYTKFSDTGDKITGKILGAGLDPDTEKPYLLIEGIDGKAHYVNQTDKIHASRLQSDLVDGHLVTLCGAMSKSCVWS
jgi:hypothetical protein